MAIQLPADVEARVREQVERGHFPDADEVIREAMRLLDQQEGQLDRLRAKLQVGLDDLARGDSVLLSPELLDEIDREVDEMLCRGEQPNPDVCP